MSDSGLVVFYFLWFFSHADFSKKVRGHSSCVTSQVTCIDILGSIPSSNAYERGRIPENSGWRNSQSPNRTLSVSGVTCPIACPNGGSVIFLSM